jgi:tetratricopeptide (TPR) repeat protein
MQLSPQASNRTAIVVLIASLLLAFAPVTLIAQDRNSGTQGETLSKAEAATAAKDWKAAAGLWQSVVDANPVNGRFWNQLGNAHYEAKDYRRAITAYEKALELREGFPSNVAYNIACCYALLGDKENAIKWLDKSFELGFRNLAHAQTDSDLESLHQDARFRKLVGLVDVSKMSREEGWRYDLTLLEREVNRKGYADGVARKISREQFHSAVKVLSDRVAKLNDAQMVAEIMKLMRSLGDGHTGLLAPPQRPEFAQTLPLQFYLFKEGLFVIGSDPKHQDLLGAQVLSLGGNSVEQLMKSLDQVISRDNEFWPSQTAPYLMRNLQLLSALGLVPEIKKAELRIRDVTGKERTVNIDADTNHPNIWNDFPESWVTYAQNLSTPLPLYLKNTRANYWFEYLPGTKTVFFQYNRVRNDQQESGKVHRASF